MGDGERIENKGRMVKEGRLALKGDGEVKMTTNGC